MAATTSHQRRRECVPSTAPKFFTIILNPLADTLRIPAEFSKRYGQNLPNRVFLKVASGPVWEVGLIQCNGETLICKGWKEFRERYSLGFGHLLVFKYNGSFQFDVHIFGTNASEINYPFDHVLNVQDNETGIENLKESDKTESDCSRKRLRSRVKHEPTSEECGNGTRRQCLLDIVEKERSFGKEASMAYQKAVSFTRAHTSLNPFFISLMKPSCVSGGFALHVAMPFAKEFLPCSNNNLTIRLLNGKAWSVNYSAGKHHANLSGGWRSFARDNALKVGDACIFEVAERSKLVWNAIIFRS